MTVAYDEAGWEDPPEPSCDPILEAQRAARLRNAADGHTAGWVLSALRETTPCGGLTARQLVIAEIGAALGLGSGAATRLVDLSALLGARLRATLAAVCDGGVSWQKACVVAEATAALTDDQAAAVQDRVLPKAAERTPA